MQVTSSIKSEKSQINLFHDIVANGYSVREVEQLAKEFAEHIQKNIKTSSRTYPASFFTAKMTHDLSKNLI